MPKPTLDADTILKRATPVTGQHTHEIQPVGHLVRMPIALSEHSCKESVENLNQLLARRHTITARRARCAARAHYPASRGPSAPLVRPASDPRTNIRSIARTPEGMRRSAAGCRHDAHAAAGCGCRRPGADKTGPLESSRPRPPAASRGC